LCGQSDAVPQPRGGGKPLAAIHAGTDHTFWGRRPQMLLACLGTWPAISGYIGRRPDPLTREVHVGAFLGTLLGIPRNLWDMKVGQHEWKHYNKAGTLPYFDVGRGSAPVPGGGYQRVVDNMKAARTFGFDRVDPLASPPLLLHGKPLVLLRGPHSNPHDYDRNRFITEKDFLGLMVASNVTVCDLGAGTSAVRFKGVLIARPSLPCRHLPDVRLDGRRDPPARVPTSKPPLARAETNPGLLLGRWPGHAKDDGDDTGEGEGDEGSDGELFLSTPAPANLGLAALRRETAL